MCKEMPVIPVNKVVDPKRIIGKNGGPRTRRGTIADPSKNYYASSKCCSINKRYIWESLTT
jgi:hypothetical protein